MNIVEIIDSELQEVKEYLMKSEQPSMAANLEKYMAKYYALSMASYFEKEVQDIIIKFVEIRSNSSNELLSFVKKKAISLQYHTYFGWGEKDQIDKPGKNANAFFSMFGESFKALIESDIRKDAELDNAIKAFLEIGHIRNILVHSNFAAFSFDGKNTTELIDIFVKASTFIDYLRKKFEEISRL